MRCAVDVAPIRAEPQDGAEQVTQALRGEPLVADGEQNGYLRVVTAYGYPGWIAAAAVEDGDGSLPGERAGSTLAEARTYLGSRYEWGGLTAAGIDCSGLVHIAYRRLGRLVPRDAWQQEEAGEGVGHPQPGDLLTYGEAQADHVAFWLGDGRILHATAREGLGVVEEPEPVELHVRRRKAVRL
jgi:cell wall-associated NlpC family hydrolase